MIQKKKYMQTGSGKEFAGDIGYKELPGGRLTLEYLLKYPEKVSDMLEGLAEIWYKKNDIGYEQEIGQY